MDCGDGAARRMVEAGLKPEDLDIIFLTHMHSDHTVDLAHVLLTGWIAYRKKPVKVIGPRYTASSCGGYSMPLNWTCNYGVWRTVLGRRYYAHRGAGSGPGRHH